MPRVEKVRIRKKRVAMGFSRDQIIAQGTRISSGAAIGTALRRRRKKMSLTQEEVADALGFSPRLVGEIERGRGTVGIDKVFAYATMLGMDIVVFER